MEKRPRRRHSYVLSLWQESGDTPADVPVWRIRLEDPDSGTQLGFHDLAALTRFLAHWMAAPGAAGAGPE